MSIVNDFDGINHAEERAAFANEDAQAPSLDLAVGTTAIVETADSTMSVWDPTTKTQTGLYLLNAMFAAPVPTSDGNTHITRASVVYDAASAHFFMVAASSDTSANAPEWLAVTQTSDPNGAWWVATIESNALPGSYSYSAPSVAVSLDKVGVTYNVLNGTQPSGLNPPTPNGTLVLEKYQVTHDAPSWQVDNVYTYGWPGPAPVIAAQEASPTTALYFTQRGANPYNGNCRVADAIVSIDGDVGNLRADNGGTDRIVDGPASACDNPESVPQPSSSTVLAPDVMQSGTLGQAGLAALHAVWENGELYITSTINCLDSANTERVCLLVEEVNTDSLLPLGRAGTASTINLYIIGSDGAYWWDPAVVLDSHGNFFFSSYEARPTDTPILAASGLEVGASTYDDTTILATSDQTPDIGSATLPYGLSTEAVLDPTDPTRMWVAGEYYGDGSQTDSNALPWSTAIEEVQLPTASTLTDNFQHLYTLDGWGGVHADGASPPISCPTYWPNWDIARGFAMTRDGLGGYVLDGWGGLHACGNATPVTDYPYWYDWDIARGVALRADGHSGYVLDGWGGLHPFGGAPLLQYSGYWYGWDIARGIALDPDGAGGYVLDGFGGLHPFGNAPAVPVTGYTPGWDISRGVGLNPDGKGGYVLDEFGGIHEFGDATAVDQTAYYGWDIARGIQVWSNSTDSGPGGWIMDGYGGIRPFGYAPDITTGGYWKGWDIARGLGGAGDAGSGRYP